MATDRELLRRYVQSGSSDAFTELVRRHVDLVYGAALRQLCGNAALAEDVTQAVFTALATKAGGLLPTTHLSAWLYTTTRYTVSHTVRAERRRQDREQKAQSMNVLLADSAGEDSIAVPPGLVDAALETLDELDREAILLRFFEGQPFSAIGLTMEVSEDAARMRVTRALEKIRTQFAKNGITTSAAAVAAALGSHAIAAPAHLVASISTAALATTGAIAAGTGAKIGLVALMSTTKGIAFISSAVALAALGYSVYEYRQAGAAAATAAAERAAVAARLEQSEARAAQLERRTTLAEARVSELQQRLDGLRTAKPLAPPGKISSDANARSAVLARMAQMKPLLEAGMPIKGAMVVVVGGKAVSQPVSFVIGRETRIENTDDGTYVVTPTLNANGSVRYAFALIKKDDAGNDNRRTLPTVTQTPWEGFAVHSGGDKAVFAFDPDGSRP